MSERRFVSCFVTRLKEVTKGRLESCIEVQDFGERHSLSKADSGRHQGSAAGHGVSPFLELALWERSPLW